MAVPPRYSELARPTLIPIGVLCFVIAAGIVLFLFNPTEHRFYPFCMFYRSTGLLCPGCGCLRSAHQLLHGHVMAALRFNALFVLTLPLAGLFAMQWLTAKISNRPFQLKIQPAWCWAGMVVLIAFGVLRNLPFAHALWLAP